MLLHVKAKMKSVWILLLMCVLVKQVRCRKFRIAWLSPGPGEGTVVNSDTSVNALKLALSSVSANPNIMNGHKIE